MHLNNFDQLYAVASSPLLLSCSMTATSFPQHTKCWCLRAHTHKHVYMQTHKYARMHTHKGKCTHTCMHAHTRTHTLICAHIHTFAGSRIVGAGAAAGEGGDGSVSKSGRLSGGGGPAPPNSSSLRHAFDKCVHAVDPSFLDTLVG